MFHLKKIFINNAIVKSIILRKCSSQNSNLIEWNYIKSTYSPQQLRHVLSTLENNNQEELKRLGLSDDKIKILESKRKEKNKFESLDDLITSNIMHSFELQNLCSNLLTKVVKKSKRTISPAIGKKKFENLKTAVGIRIKHKYISWSQLQLNGSQCYLVNWKCHELTDLSTKNNISEIIKQVKIISQCIPDADAYVMEKESSKPTSKENAGIIRSTVQHQQILAILLTLLSTKPNLNNAPANDFFSSLYTMRPYSYAHLFGLFIGNEIVSAGDVVDNLFLNSSHDCLKYVTSICFNNAITEPYHSMDNYKKDELSRSFLLTLTFFESAISNIR